MPRGVRRPVKGAGENRSFAQRCRAVNADKERNLQLLREHGWFDIPVVYNSNHRAMLSLPRRVISRMPTGPAEP